MQKITNLTNGPLDLEGKDGLVRVAAYGEAQGAFSGEYLDILRASGAVTVGSIKQQAKKAPEAKKEPIKRKPKKGER